MAYEFHGNNFIYISWFVGKGPAYERSLACICSDSK